MDIDILKETTDLERFWTARDDRMRRDRVIINLIRSENQKLDKTKWISNEPKVLYDTAVSLLSSYPPRFRLPLTVNYELEEKTKVNKAERFLLGIFRSLDDRNMGIGGRGTSYWRRELAYWICSGWWSVFTRVENRNGEVKFYADIFDPITIYPQWDSDGLTRCVRTYLTDKQTAISMATNWKLKGLDVELKEPLNNVKVINYWFNDRGKIYNAILFDEQVVKPLTEEKLFDHIPIAVGAVGVPERDTPQWKERWGENIIASNRDMFEYENLMVSLMSTIVAETAYPNIVTTTPTGAPAVKAEDMKGYSDVVPLKLGEKIELLKHAATPTEVNTLLSWVNKQRQKGGFADVVYGGVMFETSGFALSQLMATLKYKLAPYWVSMEKLIAAIGSELLYQYKKGKFPKITLTTTDPQAMKKGLFFVEDFGPKDVPDHLYIDVTIPMTSAVEKTQQILYARQALQPPQLLSRETIWDEYLDVQDSDQEYARIIQDEVTELPIVKQIGVIESLKDKARDYRAVGNVAAADTLDKYIKMMENSLLQPAAPTKPEGIRPETMPPEMMQSPDMMRSAMGVAPPGLARRRQTPEERAETK